MGDLKEHEGKETWGGAILIRIQSWKMDILEEQFLNLTQHQEGPAQASGVAESAPLKLRCNIEFSESPVRRER